MVVEVKCINNMRFFIYDKDIINYLIMVQCTFAVSRPRPRPPQLLDYGATFLEFIIATQLLVHIQSD